MNSHTGSRPGRVPPVASIYNVAVPTLPGLLFGECDVESGFPLADTKWATFNPSLYQNMDNDQVDWGALAQQWIQMREAMPIVTSVPGMLPPGSILNDGCSYPPPPRIIAYEEQGEAPMEVEKDDDQSANLPLPPMPPPPIICGHDWDGKWQTESITQQSSTSPKGWSPEGGTVAWEGASIASDVASNATSNHASPDRVVSKKKTFPSSTTASSSSASSVRQSAGMKERWQTKSGHSYPSEHQGKRVRSRFLMDASTERGPGTKMGVEPKPRLPGLMDHAIKFSETTRSDTLAVKKGSVIESAGTLNDAKRKLLPAWIREGLEKMEKDKQRKMERTQLLRRTDENDALSEQRCLTDTESPEAEFPCYPEPDIIQPSEKSPACVSSAAVQKQPKLTEAGESKKCVESDVRTTRAQQLKESMRTILTNILLEVTNEEIVRIAKETHVKLQRKVIPAQTRRTETGRVTCIGGVGLVVYGDSDEEEEDCNELVNDRKTDENPENERDDKNSDSDEPPDDTFSDATIEQYLQKRIRRKQREFQPIASKIEQCLEEENLAESRGQLEVAGKREANQPMAYKIECTKNDNGVGNVVSDESAEVDTYRVQERHGTTDLANGTNKDREAITKVTGRPKDAERKRHNKRISRFSNPRDTVRQTHVTHVSIMPSTKPTTISSTEIENGDGNFGESNHQLQHHQLLHPERLPSSTGIQRNPVSNAIDFLPTCYDAAQLPKCQENTSKSSGRPAATAGILWSIESTLKLSSDGSGPSNGSGQNSSKARSVSHERKETSGHRPGEVLGESEQLHAGNTQASGSVLSLSSASMVSDRGRSRRHRSRSTVSSRSSSSRSGHCSGSNRSGRSRQRSRRSRSHSLHSSSSSTKNPPPQKCTANPATSRHGHSHLYRDAEVKKTSSSQSHGSQRYRDEKHNRDRSHSRSRHLRRSRSPSKYTSSSRRKH
ncbi:arginine/serine-rich protein PNISR-like [Anopheles bellator]|uniref:arginine/serine-rich protein PNISR-like n=1 Tax=Anopheles bellator TaxID=139047 RepID=UPI0026473E90|nr:arginine/serine-rich protein PNISR-like [Anopheles bellator]